MVQAMTERTRCSRICSFGDSILYTYTTGPYAEIAVQGADLSNARVSYYEHNGSIYYSNGTDRAHRIWYFVSVGAATPDAPGCFGDCGDSGQRPLFDRSELPQMPRPGRGRAFVAFRLRACFDG